MKISGPHGIWWYVEDDDTGEILYEDIEVTNCFNWIEKQKISREA